MTKQEQAIAAAAYETIKAKASNLTFIDRMVLMGALNKDSAFRDVPAAQQRLFLDVAMSVVRALQQQANGGQG